MTKIVAITNQKGGVGKSCTAYNTGYCTALKGLKTLLISMDPSADAIEPYCNEDEEFDFTIVDVLLEKDFNPSHAIYKAKVNNSEIENLYFIPTDINLSLEQSKLSSKAHREKLLIKQLDKIKHNFDIILIDCPPLLTEFSIIAVYAADFIIIPLRYERDAVKGIKGLFKTLSEVKEDQEYDYKILRTGFDARKTKTIKKIDMVLNNIQQDRIFNTIIRQDEELNQAKLENLPIIVHSPKTRGALDYMSFTQELLKDD